MTGTITRSEAVLALLRLRLSGLRVGVSPGNLAAYRELVHAGIMYPVSTNARGPEWIFGFIEEGRNRREEWLRDPAAAPNRIGQATA